MKVHVTPELEATLKRRQMILSVCVECQEGLGEQDAQGALGGVSGGYCVPCLDAFMSKHGDGKRIDTEHAPAALRMEAFAHDAMVTVAVIASFVIAGLAFGWAIR